MIFLSQFNFLAQPETPTGWGTRFPSSTGYNLGPAGLLCSLSCPPPQGRSLWGCLLSSAEPGVDEGVKEAAAPTAPTTQGTGGPALARVVPLQVMG